MSCCCCSPRHSTRRSHCCRCCCCMHPSLSHLRRIKAQEEHVLLFAQLQAVP